MARGGGHRAAAMLLPAVLGLWASTTAAQQVRPAPAEAAAATRQQSQYRILRVDLPAGPGGPQAGVCCTRVLVGFGSRQGVQRGSVFTVSRDGVSVGTVRVDEVWRDTSVVSLLTLRAKPAADSQYPLERGDTLEPRYVLLGSVEVGDTEPRLSPEMQERLHAAARMLRDFPDFPLLIEGHTDDAGKAADNLKRSEERATRVRDFLQQTYLVPVARLHVRGYGEAEPIAANSTIDGRSANRRVDLILVDQVPPEPPPAAPRRAPHPSPSR